MTDTAQQVLARSALVIAGWPQLCTKLLAAHTCGPDGRCVGCPSAVHVAPRWPCRIAALATTAHAVAAAQVRR